MACHPSVAQAWPRRQSLWTPALGQPDPTVQACLPQPHPAPRAESGPGRLSLGARVPWGRAAWPEDCPPAWAVPWFPRDCRSPQDGWEETARGGWRCSLARAGGRPAWGQALGCPADLGRPDELVGGPRAPRPEALPRQPRLPGDAQHAPSRGRHRSVIKLLRAAGARLSPQELEEAGTELCR